jgi:hypothetical protein
LWKTIVVYVAGFLLALMGHRIATGVLPSGPNANPVRRELAVGRVAWLISAFLLYEIAHVVSEWSVYWSGLQNHLLSDNKSALLLYRMSAVSSYAFVVITYNVLPFLVTALWLHVRLRPTVPTVALAVVSVVFTAGMLLLTFQTMPLMVFVVALAATEIAASGMSRTESEGTQRRWVLRGLLLLPVLFYVASLSIRTLRRGAVESSVATGPALEIFGRISSCAPHFVHYYPDVEPHYGLSGIGLYAFLTGQPLYAPAVVVYRDFTGGMEGSAAMAAIVDFYCAFGWIGWALCNLALGAGLALLDKQLARLGAGESRAIAVVFAFVYCMHLGEATVFTASLGYGGVFFLVLWFLVFRPVRQESAVGAAAVVVSASRKQRTQATCAPEGPASF